MVLLPAAFEEKMKRILKEEFEEFRAGYENPRQFALRLNRNKITKEEFLEKAPFSLKEIPWIDNGFYYGEEDRPSRHPFYYAGLYYLQEPSAMTPANLLNARPGERILDLCAAPGGKTTELGAGLSGKGFLAANDISGPRARALLKNVEVFGISNSLILNEVPAKIAAEFPEFFDKILVDAPCSGEGMFRKDQDTAKEWRPEKPIECAKMQREILSQAVKMLRPGGTLLYSTCTFSPEEDEQMMAWLLKERPDFSIIRPERWYEGFGEGRPELVEEEWLPTELWKKEEFAALTEEQKESLKNCIRIWPHKMGGEGHFLAILKREGSLEEVGHSEEKPVKKNRGKNAGRKEPKKAEAEGFLSFAEDLKVDWDFTKVEVRKDQVYLVPEESAKVRGLVFLRNGLYLGEEKKNRFEPSQALAAALKKSEYACTIDLSQNEERLLRYLKGETIEIFPGEAVKTSGWQLVCVEGHPIGWGKLVNGMLKNKFLQSWRMNV